MPKGRVVGLHGAAIVVLVVGLAVSSALFVAARGVGDRDEDRLLRQRVLAASSIVVSSVPATQAPLVAAAEQAEETDGRADSFARIMAAQVGPGRRWISASLWRNGSTAPLSVYGAAPALTSRAPEEIKAFIEDAAAHEGLAVFNLLDAPDPRVGVAAASSRPGIHYVVYAESVLPADRTSVAQPEKAFADLDYAVYLGKEETAPNLLLASTRRVPITGRRSSVDVAFGNSTLRVVMSPRAPLGGAWNPRIPWLLGAAGILLTLGATALAERLLRSRDQAERLSEENAALYAAQRSVAQGLQHSMLPAVLPSFGDAEYQVRYVAGTADLDVGGDWYDVVDLGHGRSFFVVGDVSGRGLEAAIVMASLRYAIRAYATDGDDPSTVLTKLGGLLDVTRDGRFATVLCGELHTPTGEVRLASAGHLPPVIVDDTGCTIVDVPVGLPIGIRAEVPYSPITMQLRPGATLLLFTDGLVERRGEPVDVGVARLCRTVDRSGPLDEVLGRLLADLTSGSSEDDVAILGVRWQGINEMAGRR